MLPPAFTRACVLLLFLFSVAQAAGPTDTAPNQHAPANDLATQLKARAAQLHLAEHPVWAALLHSREGRAYNRDRSFLLSLPRFSQQAELDRSLDALYQGDTQAVCRFPARYLWLKQMLDAPALPLEQCTELTAFRAKVPLDEMALAFASETLLEPSSMLGHSFLKLAGTAADGTVVTRAVSFFTDSGTWNLPQLLYDALVVGKKGYFTLTLYDRKLAYYVDQSQRSVWEFPLTLDRHQLDLIQMHLFELQQTQLVYFFDTYNCADVVEFIIAVGAGNLGTHGVWRTPRSILQDVATAGLLQAPQEITPSSAFLRQVSDALSRQQIDEIQTAVQQQQIPAALHNEPDAALLELDAMQAYNNRARKRGELTEAHWRSNREQLDALRLRQFNGHTLASQQPFNPLLTPAETQLSLGYAREAGQDVINVDFLPVSHTLSDDNQHYDRESELKLFDIGLRLDPAHPHPVLDHVDVYALQIYTPWHSLSGGQSGRVRFGLSPSLDQQLGRRTTLSAAGAWGGTLRPVTPLDVYGLAGAEVGYAAGRGYLIPQLETGLILREGAALKTVASLSRSFGQIDSGFADTGLYTFKTNQSWYIAPQLTFNLELRTDWNREHQRHALGANAKWLF